MLKRVMVPLARKILAKTYCKKERINIKSSRRRRIEKSFTVLDMKK